MKRIGRLNGGNHGDLAVSLDTIPPLTCTSMLSYHVTADYKSAALPLRHAGSWSHPGSEATISLQPGRRRAEVRSVGRGAAGTRRGRDAAEIHQTGVSPWPPSRPTTDSWAPVQSRARSRLPSQAEPEHGQAIPRRPGLPAGTRRRSRGVRNPCRQPARRGRRLLVDPVHRRSRGNRGRRHRRLARRRKKGPRPGDPARVINTGSIDGIQLPDMATLAYSASRAGIHQLSRHLEKGLQGRASRLMRSRLARFRAR